MVKPFIIAIMLIEILSCLYSNVVINELLYDPIGTDTGLEWLELYNNGDTDIDLEGAKIQIAGTTFTTAYTFPHYILRAHRFVLIGEQNITQAVFTTTLAMQNGDTGTDGVRYVSPDGFYTDTVLYDNPNASNLTDDYGNIGSHFAPDVFAGSSLARRVDGLDTGNCETDFMAEAYPTPGYPNHVAIDYALVGTEVIYANDIYTLNTDIFNQSQADDDTLSIFLDVVLNGQILQSFDIQPIASGASIPFTTPINITPQSIGTLSIELMLFNDINLADNIWTMQLGELQQLTLGINEILYNPATGNQEWIELYIPPIVCANNVLTIMDAADNSVQITLPSLCPQYLVVCRDQDLLMEKYPDCPGGSIIEVSSLPALNNEGDSIILLDDNGTVIDSMSYIGNANKKDYSLERQINADSTICWHYCYADAKGTPGQSNSVAPPPSSLETGHVKLIGSPFNPLSNESMHLQYKFRDNSNSINCCVYDLDGIKRHTIASGIEIGSTGEIVWNGKDNHGKAFPRGIYVLLTEAKDSSNKYFFKKQLTVVLATK